MKIGFLDLELNGQSFMTLGNKKFPSKEVSWIILGFRFPDVNLPFYTRNMLGEWQRSLGISFSTILQVTYVSNISWEFHFRVFGFGIAFCYQYGY